MQPLKFFEENRCQFSSLSAIIRNNRYNSKIAVLDILYKYSDKTCLSAYFDCSKPTETTGIRL